MNRVFLLSPARAGGRRARVLAGGQATFELARQTQAGEATLGDVFAFCSGLYFRGKLSYAKTFARPPAGIPGVQVITPSRGLLPADWRIGVADLGEFASVEVSAVHPGFADPSPPNRSPPRAVKWCFSAASRRENTRTACCRFLAVVLCFLRRLSAGGT